MAKKPKLVCGSGLNDADYPVHVYALNAGRWKKLWVCPAYQTWQNMLVRCHNTKLHAKYPTYAGCSVASEWHKFSVFREWMLRQPWEGAELDKDILSAGNKVYSPDTCVFVSSRVNSFMTDGGSSRSEWPIGVHWDKDNCKFKARCRDPFIGKQEHLGYFACPGEAHEAWRARKHQHACTYADMQEDPRIAAALRSRYAKVDESTIRKRHQPGEYSFDALKQILAMPVSRGDFA